MTTLLETLNRHLKSATPLEVIYFGGGQPGQLRAIIPIRYCEKRGNSHLIGICHRSGIEKTFRLDRLHLPEAPLTDGKNDFLIIAKILGDSRMLERMLTKIASLQNLPIEEALAVHLLQQCGFKSFFDEYAYGGYTLELKLTSAVIYLSLGYEANDCETIHYHFTAESEPQLMPEIGTHYALLTGKPTRR